MTASNKKILSKTTIYQPLKFQGSITKSSDQVMVVESSIGHSSSRVWGVQLMIREIVVACNKREIIVAVNKREIFVTFKTVVKVERMSPEREVFVTCDKIRTERDSA
jgi:hypothetical protein